ncbi:unnamed protein product [Closterium sp. Naga37s-1]|nr:unnamed protein product [Closterium sp. Naga37s-1]
MVRDDVLLHCPSSVRTLVKRHVYSRFVNSSYLFAGTSNIFRVSEGATMLPPSHAAALPCGRPPMRPPSHAAALPCCRPPIPSAHTTHPTHLTLSVSLYHPSDQVTTRANVDFFLPHVDLVAAGNSTTELLIIASGQAQFVLHEGDCVGGEYGAYEFCQASGDVVRASERSAMGGRAKEDLGRVVSKLTESSRALFLSSTLSTSLMCCPTPIRPSLDSPEIAFLCDLTELWTVRTLSVRPWLALTPLTTATSSPTCLTGECSVPIHASPTTPFLIHLLSRARSRAEATARFYPGNSTMAEPSLLLKDEVEPVLNGIDIFFFYPLSHTFANRRLAPTPSSPTLPHSCRNPSSSLPFFHISAPFLKDTSLDLLLSSPHSPH